MKLKIKMKLYVAVAVAVAADAVADADADANANPGGREMCMSASYSAKFQASIMYFTCRGLKWTSHAIDLHHNG